MWQRKCNKAQLLLSDILQLTYWLVSRDLFLINCKCFRRSPVVLKGLNLFHPLNREVLLPRTSLCPKSRHPCCWYYSKQSYAWYSINLDLTKEQAVFYFEPEAALPLYCYHSKYKLYLSQHHSAQYLAPSLFPSAPSWMEVSNEILLQEGERRKGCSNRNTLC